LALLANEQAQGSSGPLTTPLPTALDHSLHPSTVDSTKKTKHHQQPRANELQTGARTNHMRGHYSSTAKQLQPTNPKRKPRNPHPKLTRMTT
jgi:hypothetical protein